jgi:hypothetical protein
VVLVEGGAVSHSEAQLFSKTNLDVLSRTLQALSPKAVLSLQNSKAAKRR